VFGRDRPILNRLPTLFPSFPTGIGGATAITACREYFPVLDNVHKRFLAYFS
jgi:hypothetical protein